MSGALPSVGVALGKPERRLAEISPEKKPTRGTQQRPVRPFLKLPVRSSRPPDTTAGTRTIAARAGVDARLIGRYFGTEEQLFTEVIEHAYADHLMMTPETNAEAGRALLTDPTRAHHDGMLLTLRSASNERAAAIMRDSLERTFQRALGEKLAGPDAVPR